MANRKLEAALVWWDAEVGEFPADAVSRSRLGALFQCYEESAVFRAIEMAAECDHLDSSAEVLTESKRILDGWHSNGVTKRRPIGAGR